MLNKPLKYVAIVLLTALFLYLLLDNSADISLPVTLNTQIENAVFTDYEGNIISLDRFEGKLVLLDFWETWCVPCLRSFPGLAELQNEQPERFVVIAVSPGMSDEDEDVLKFIAEHPEYPFVWVKGFELADALNIEGIPYKIFVGPDGKYITTELGSRGPARDKQKIEELMREIF